MFALVGRLEVEGSPKGRPVGKPFKLQILAWKGDALPTLAPKPLPEAKDGQLIWASLFIIAPARLRIPENIFIYLYPHSFIHHGLKFLSHFPRELILKLHLIEVKICP